MSANEYIRIRSGRRYSIIWSNSLLFVVYPCRLHRRLHTLLLFAWFLTLLDYHLALKRLGELSLTQNMQAAHTQTRDSKKQLWGPAVVKIWPKTDLKLRIFSNVVLSEGV
jgi:hypothetical protein